jgi:NADH-quinone oxidoreductase E subunit
MLTEQYGAEIDRILAKYPDKRSAVMPLMYLAQEAYGYMSQQAMDDVAAVLDLDPTHVLSLAGFYTLYYEKPVGKYVLEICNDLPCALRGADEFVEMASRKLGIPVEGTTGDGLFTLKTVMCLAACDKAPMLQCNLQYVENLDEAKFDDLIEQLRAGRLSIAPTPYTATIAPQFIAPQDKAVVAEPAAADNLELIEGIGPRIAEILQAAGMTTFAQLAATTEDQLNQILDAAHLQFSDPASWMAQARLAAAGDWDGLKTLQDQLKGGH